MYTICIHGLSKVHTLSTDEIIYECEKSMSIARISANQQRSRLRVLGN